MPSWLTALGRWFLRQLFAEVTFAPESLERLREAAARGSILYVGSTLSVLEFLCWRHLLNQADLPTPLAVNGLTRRASPELFSRLLSAGRAVFFFLRKGLRKRAPVGFAGPYEMAFLGAATARPIVAVPLLLVWRDATLRVASRPWLEAFLGPQDEPGVLWRLMQLVWRRNRAEAIVAEPIDLAGLAAGLGALRPEAQAKRLRFELSGAIERARRARLGPPRKSMRRLRQEILRSRRLVSAVEEEAKTIGKKRAWRRANDYLSEIAANLKTWMLVFTGTILTRVFRRIYERIEVDQEGLERLRAAARKGPVILVPSHRSHVDYLVLTYILIEHGLAPPLVASGANLSFFPMGFLFRRGGAFFLRRSFGGNHLYTAVFREYVRKMLREGYSIEFFIEGGRSRTGKLLQPKLGLLGIIVDVAMAGDVSNVQVMPVSIAYDKVIEEGAYASELAGGEKRREDLGAVLRAGRVLASNYGSLYLHFDQPFDLSQAIANVEGSGRRVAVQRIAHRIVWGITRSSVVTPTALVAAALLARGRRGVTRTDLLLDTQFLYERVRAASAAGAGGRLAPALSDKDGQLCVAALDRSIELLQRDGDLQIRGVSEDVMYVVPDERRLHLDYYRNTALHSLVAEALLATALVTVRRQGEPDEAARERTLELSRLFKNEFIYEVDRPFDAIFDSTWKRLEEASALGDPARMALLAGLVRDFVESYYVTAVGLQQGKTSEKDLLALGEKLYLQGIVTRREALSKENMRNAMQGQDPPWQLLKTIVESDPIVTR